MTGAPGDGREPAQRAATWDREVVRRLRALQEPGAPDFVAELVATFLAESAKDLAALTAAAASGDLVSAARAAHRIKGAAASVGAVRVSAVAAVVERTAGRGDAAGLPGLVTDVAAEIDRVRTEPPPR